MKVSICHIDWQSMFPDLLPQTGMDREHVRFFSIVGTDQVNWSSDQAHDIAVC